MQDSHTLQKIISETVLERGWSDFKDRFASVPFWVAEIVGGGMLGILYDPYLAIAGILILAMAVIVAATVTAPLRQRDDARKYAESLIPKIELDFNKSLGGIIETPEKIKNKDETVKKEYDATYIRIRAKTKSRKTVHNCIPFLIDVKKKNKNGIFEETKFIDPLQSPWSLLGVSALDIPPMVSRSIDVLYSTTRRPNELYFCGVWPLTLRDFFKDHTTYRLTLLVAGDDVTESISIDVHWNGDRSNIEVERV